MALMPPHITKTHPLIQEIAETIYYDNRTVLIAIVGKRGKGKSMLGLKLMWMLDKAFQDVTYNWEGAKKLIEERVAFEPAKFLKIINSSALEKGSCIMMEEAGVNLSSREWYSFNNKAVDRVVQMFRHRNLITIFNMPNFNYVDSHIRNSFDYLIVCEDIKKETKETVAKVYRLQFNKIDDSMYTKFIRSRQHGRYGRMKVMLFKIVHPNIALAYEEYSVQKKQEKEMDIWQSVERRDKQMEERETKKEQKDRMDSEIVSEILQDISGYQTNFQGRRIISSAMIKAKFGVSVDRGKMIRALVEEELRKRERMESEPISIIKPSY